MDEQSAVKIGISLLAALLLGGPSLYGIFLIYRELETRRLVADVRRIRTETLREKALAAQLRAREMAANEMARLEQERRFEERLAEARIRQRLSQRKADADFVELLRAGARNTPEAQALLDQAAPTHPGAGA